jgi:hypothetical protein
MVRDLQRAFRNFYRHRPNYSLLPVTREQDAAAGTNDGELSGGAGVLPAGDAGASGGEDLGEPPVTSFLPPGPLAEVRLRPATLKVAPNRGRRVTALAVDATGRPIEEDVRFTWEVTRGVGMVEEDAGGSAGAGGAGRIGRCVVTFQAADVTGEGALIVVANTGSERAEAEAPVEITDDLPDRGSNEGIPDPELVDSPSERWRSRMQEDRWQVNAGHPDFRELADRPALKLRYLAMLFAKEVVLHDQQDPRFAAPLEQLVEVAAYADRQIAGKRKGKKEAEGDLLRENGRGE